MKALLSQERPGHTETLGSFISILNEFGIDVDICAPNAYSYLTVYSKLGLQFRRVGKEEVLDNVASRAYGVVVFNSAHLLLSEEYGPFSIKLLREVTATDINPRHVVRLHHMRMSATRLKGFSEIATTNLLARFIDRVHTPYFAFPGHTPAPAADISVCLLGGTSPSAIEHRNLDKLEELLTIIEGDKLPLSVRWYCSDIPPHVKSRFSRFRNLRFRLKLNALQIVEEMNTVKPVFATFFKPKSRYHKSSLTGVVPFAIGASAPVLMDAELAEIYRLDHATIVEKSVAGDIESLLALRDKFDVRHRQVQAIRERKILHNRRQFGEILNLTRPQHVYQTKPATHNDRT
jgi:hypothetical protein